MSSFSQRKKNRAVRAALVGTAGFVAFWAGAGAIGLIGGGVDLGAEITARLPFQSPIFAGTALALLVGAPMTATAVLALRSHPAAAPTAMAGGTILLGWVVMQPFIIGQVSWMQAVFGVLGTAVGALGFRLARFRTGTPTGLARPAVA
ncbi:hypothetical protein [Nocardia farcinica]|uniref:Uncharacterized protein n=1 Tax=Nocardia farcinica TaxID=37329 RepID=A0A449HBQ1_NOCFR|nr:hypothetical protein [Nocardia farcinica]MBA4857655.1 hypothetical protein [Nocardia farcinica]MBC9817856.1 hypothetical protein [Nocardia farcinica]MBF6359723.1 hypothetical protein [Nocardia farcinica]SUE29399.1 Uncharacterised protein [Nocardia farcinica]VFA95406.1 Uncharacterised protein [Nocardia farcinica]